MFHIARIKFRLTYIWMRRTRSTELCIVIGLATVAEELIGHWSEIMLLFVPDGTLNPKP